MKTKIEYRCEYTDGLAKSVPVGGARSLAAESLD
jgi:hypothetical protein